MTSLMPWWLYWIFYLAVGPQSRMLSLKYFFLIFKCPQFSYLKSHTKLNSKYKLISPHLTLPSSSQVPAIKLLGLYYHQFRYTLLILLKCHGFENRWVTNNYLEYQGLLTKVLSIFNESLNQWYPSLCENQFHTPCLSNISSNGR